MQTVLAIDDSPEIHSLLDVRLRSEGILLHHAMDALTGLQQARLLGPDLVLLDIEMPSMSGFDVCHELKGDPATSHIPVIFLTADSDVVAKVRGLDLGAVDYVTKPFHTAELIARVRAALRTKRYQDLLSVRARLDALTGLWNRAYFDQRHSDEIEACRRYGRILSLLMVDLDHFKRINDTHGHPFGDRVLQAAGELLQNAIRSTDAACRYGGEEFAILLPETGLDGAMLLAQRIHTQLAAIAFSGRKTLTITASLGVASTEMFEDRASINTRSLLMLADDALYEAKNSGRNCIISSKGVIRLSPSPASRS